MERKDKERIYFYKLMDKGNTIMGIPVLEKEVFACAFCAWAEAKDVSREIKAHGYCN